MTAYMTQKAVTPLCPVFGACGGCQYQDIPYKEELKIKENYLKSLLADLLKGGSIPMDSIEPSPKEYHYRNRLDLRLKKTKTQEILIGFTDNNNRRIVEVFECPLAMEPISGFFPRLKQEVSAKLSAKYQNANLVVKTGERGEVCWGGIGRRSLVLPQEKYLWTTLNSKRIFYSLDSFFQANLSILPKVIRKIRETGLLKKDVHLYDLYGGVGLFSVSLYEDVKAVTLIEENKYATRIAEYNKEYNGLNNWTITTGRVEEHLKAFEHRLEGQTPLAIVDPPRQGLSAAVVEALADSLFFKNILYLSCNPEALLRDLTSLMKGGLKVKRVMPFDFFSKTRHIETLVLLSR